MNGRVHRTPSLDWEMRLWQQGYSRVAGIDEAGRGAWAGPVVAAAVILPPDDGELAQRLEGVCDSKLLPPARREALVDVISRHALAIGVGAVPPAGIDAMGIVAATRQAMALALRVLCPPAECLLIDYLRLPDIPLPQECMPHGDSLVLSIAAASIVAKVSRDRIMAGLEAVYPGYGFARHKGYGTEEHQAALSRLGPSATHRYSFAPLHPPDEPQELARPAGGLPSQAGTPLQEGTPSQEGTHAGVPLQTASSAPG